MRRIAKGWVIAIKSTLLYVLNCLVVCYSTIDIVFVLFRIFLSNLKSIVENGGIIPCVKVVVQLRFPILYMQRTGEDFHVLSLQEHLHASEIREAKINKVRWKYIDKFKQQVMQDFSTKEA